MREPADRPPSRRGWQRTPGAHWPVPPRGPEPAAPHRPQWTGFAAERGGVDVCDRCRAFEWACFCETTPARLALFARRIAELHPPSGQGCGCGGPRCVYRQRLDDVRAP